VLLPAADVPSVIALNTLGVSLLVGVIALYMLSYIALGAAMTHWEASRVSAMITLTPLFTLIFSERVVLIALAYRAAESDDLLSLCGAAMVVGGSFLAAMPRRRYA